LCLWVAAPSVLDLLKGREDVSLFIDVVVVSIWREAAKPRHFGDGGA